MSTPTSTENIAGEDDEASFSREALPANFHSALDEFRESWHRELKSQGDHINFVSTRKDSLENPALLSPLSKSERIIETDPQLLAESLFRQAVQLEQNGKVYDALPLYRRATQIVPDIEFKYYERQKNKAELFHAANSSFNQIDIKSDEGNDTEEENNDDLYEKFQLELALSNDGKMLRSNKEPGTISTELHISQLPPEILLYILRWVASAQLDMRSVEQCASVCKGFYLCARDEEMWRLACQKVWGPNLGTLNNPIGSGLSDVIIPKEITTYSSWRQMFIERERIIFNGCYISKTTYLRMGENSFQDQFYRPVQLVEYYRYIRFFPDGTVLMMTNADEPAQGVTRLRNFYLARPDILRGHYRLYGNTVTILLNKQQRNVVGTGTRQRRGSSAFNSDITVNNTKYCIEFSILNSPRRKFAQLVWKNYSMVQSRNKLETTTEFELTQSKYPPLWFSLVRSYHQNADAPLN